MNPISRLLPVVCLLATGMPLVSHAQSTTPSAREIVRQLSGSVPHQASDEAPMSRSLSMKLRPDPATSLCESGATAKTASTEQRSRSLYAESAPAIDLDIAFDHNSAVLKPEGRKILDTLAEALRDKALAASSFVVAGHTNKIGEDDYNRRLSCARALSVRDYLRDQRKIASKRLIPMGFGFSRLKLSNDPTADDNRRVEIRKTAD